MPAMAFGHGGGLDSSGGHRSGSSYHYHRSSYTPPAHTTPSSFGTSYRSSARTEARTSARSYDYRERIRAEQDRRDALIADRIKEDEAAELRAREIENRLREEANREMRAHVAAEYHRMAPRFTLHHSTLHPYEAVELLDNEEYWRILLAKGWYINLNKSRIVRVEPIECPTEYRTWVDASGAFSLVAKLEKAKKPYVQLTSINGRTHSVNADKLSDVDRRYLKSLLSGISSKSPTFYKCKEFDQVAKASRFCVLDGKASAEVVKTTRGNEILDDKQWKYPKHISIVQYGTVDDLLASAFPTEIWDEIDETEFDRLSILFR